MTAARAGFRAGRVAVWMAAFALSGCGFWRNDQSCESVEEYQGAQSVQEISVPDGLHKPESATKLKIPAAPQAGEPPSSNVACLQRPPNYFDRPLQDAGN